MLFVAHLRWCLQQGKWLLPLGEAARDNLWGLMGCYGAKEDSRR